ncbi:MAG: hypothetical protein ACTHM6_02465 [Tepidisphaeraceae bacterium]
MDSLESKMILRARKTIYRERKINLRARKTIFRERKTVFRARKNFLRARKMHLILLCFRRIAGFPADSSILSGRLSPPRRRERKNLQNWGMSLSDALDGRSLECALGFWMTMRGHGSRGIWGSSGRFRLHSS